MEYVSSVEFRTFLCINRSCLNFHWVLERLLAQRQLRESMNDDESGYCFSWNSTHKIRGAQYMRECESWGPGKMSLIIHSLIIDAELQPTHSQWMFYVVFSEYNIDWDDEMTRKKRGKKIFQFPSNLHNSISLTSENVKAPPKMPEMLCFHFSHQIQVQVKEDEDEMKMEKSNKQENGIFPLNSLLSLGQHRKQMIW